MPALLLAAAVGVLYLAAWPHTADLAAQTYRAELFDRAGFALWDNGWYARPPPAGLQPAVPAARRLARRRGCVGALALLVATAGIRPARGPPKSNVQHSAATAAAVWFAVALGAATISGRIPFALGAASRSGPPLPRSAGRIGAAGVAGRRDGGEQPGRRAVPGARRRGRVVARPRRRPRAATPGSPAAVCAALTMIAAGVLAFPEGGSEPFVPVELLAGARRARRSRCDSRRRDRCEPAPRSTRCCWSRRSRSRPRSAATPRGLGALLAGPLALLVLLPARRLLLAAALLPLAWWTLYPAGRDWIDADGDPATKALVLRAAAGELSTRSGSRRPRRDPVHRPPLGGRARRLAVRARSRLGAPVRPQGQRRLLRRRR